jgi:hypothetical protein
MAGFETVVRPAIFPNIRPAAPAQPVAPQADPTQGLAVITGSSGKSMDLPYSWNVSISQSKRVETKRRVDEVRVYQKEDDGTINKDNYIDTEVANKINYRGGKQPGRRDFVYVDPNTKIDPDQGLVSENGVVYLKRQKPADNIQIIKADKVVINPDDPGE